MAGIMYGVGIGPGDPELLTLKAARIIRESQVIGIPAEDTASCTAWQIAVQAVPGMAEKEVLSVAVPMTKDKQRLDAAYNGGCEKIAAALEAGKQIAFLNLGDPTLYGTYMVLHRKIQERGYRAELVSGVPSICAVAAALDWPLGERSEAVHILPGSYDLDALKELKGTRVLMKSASKVGDVKKLLVELEEAGSCKAMAVTNCGMADQTICREIGSLQEDAGYFTTIIVKDQDR